MQLGAAYNIFDGEELLEFSIRSIRKQVCYVCVVYQTISNFGYPCNPSLVKTLNGLVKSGLVDELVPYTPRENFDIEYKKAAISKRATGTDLGGAQANEVGTQFFNELNKREIGRQYCEKKGCTHFMTMDADECWHDEQLAYVKRVMLEKNYEGSCCKMRFFFRYPTRELLPYDDLNHVPILYKISENMPFKLACPYPALIDPTRKLENLRRFHIFERDEIEMFHYSLVRQNMRSKLMNVSNRQNYQDVDRFVGRFNNWKPSDGVIHPHPFFREKFKKLRVVKNWFGICADGLNEDESAASADKTKEEPPPVVPKSKANKSKKQTESLEEAKLDEVAELKQAGTDFFKQDKFHEAKREYTKALTQVFEL